MSRMQGLIFRTYGGISADDKLAVMEQLYDGPKTTRQMAANLDLDAIHTRNIVSNLVSIGMVEQVGRGHGGAKVWGAKA